jgi:hypothetical protein
MDTPEEIERDEWYSELYENISTEAITSFTSGRLRSYYIENPSLAKGVVATYKEARSLVTTSPNAALILFTTTIEVALKTTVLKPVIYGLVHNASIADLVSDLVVKNNGLDRFKDVLSKIMAQYSDVDFDNYKVDGHAKTVWEQILVIQKARNGILHRAEPVTEEMVKLSDEIATTIIIDFLQGILAALNLQLQKDGSISS